jgi:hypothetical protein
MIEHRMNNHGDDKSRQKCCFAERLVLADKRACSNSEYCSCTTVHERCAETADDPGSELRLGDDTQKIEVLENCEARADGEAEASSNAGATYRVYVVKSISTRSSHTRLTG